MCFEYGIRISIYLAWHGLMTINGGDKIVKASTFGGEHQAWGLEAHGLSQHLGSEGSHHPIEVRGLFPWLKKLEGLLGVQHLVIFGAVSLDGRHHGSTRLQIGHNRHGPKGNGCEEKPTTAQSLADIGDKPLCVLPLWIPWLGTKDSNILGLFHTTTV